MEIKFFRQSKLEAIIDLGNLNRLGITLKELLDIQLEDMGRDAVQLGESPVEALPLEGSWCWCCGWPIEGGEDRCKLCQAEWQVI